MTVVGDQTMRCGGDAGPHYGLHVTARLPSRTATMRRRAAAVAAAAGLAVLSAPLAAGASPVARPAAVHEGKQAVLVQMEDDLKAETSVTFAATYEGVGSGNATTFSYDQKPSDWLFSGFESTTKVEVVRIGNKVYSCDLSSTPPLCAVESEASYGGTAFGVFADLALQELELDSSLESSHVAGFSVTTSSRTLAGQRSTCATISVEGTRTEICVTDAHGVLDYEGQAGLEDGTLLERYSSSVSSSLFVLPKGATTRSGTTS